MWAISPARSTSKITSISSPIPIIVSSYFWVALSISNCLFLLTPHERDIT